MNDTTWRKWNDEWNWILAVAESREWDSKSLEIKPSIDISKIQHVEKELGFQYPEEFKEVLTKYSGGVKFGWQIPDEGPPDEFSSIFCGCGGVSAYRLKAGLWDFENLKQLHSTYQGWISDCFDDPNDEYGKHYYDKIPFIEVPNGDLIVFDKHGQVIYLSHDDGPLHGEKLADNFIEFISLWSNIGCVGTESEQFSVFYDEGKQKLMDNDAKIDRWKEWLGA